MISLNDAREIARAALQPGTRLYEKPFATRDFGWVFGYQSEDYLSNGHVEDMLVGNAPYLVLKDGQLLTLGTAFPLRHYLDCYERYGDPHLEPGPQLELLGAFRRDRNAIEAIREIRAATGLGLASAKSLVDLGLAGKKPVVDCDSVAEASALAERLRTLGFGLRQLPR